MRMYRSIVSIVALAAISSLLWGCAKKDDGTTADPGTDSAHSMPSAADSGRAASEPAAPTTEGDTNANAPQKKIEEARAAFLALQQVCKANDIDGYVAFWDDETKKEIDGRALTVAERRERRRQRLLEKPEDLEEIASATIESIEADTTQAEKLEQLHGQKVEGTMIVVFTDGPALLFHETANGWKLFTKSTSSYFREGQ